MARYNPFRPGSVISPGMFTGRTEEMKAVEQALFQTKHGNPNHFIIEGERGIGKSSLFLLLDYIANGRIDFESGTKLNFIVANIELRESIDYDGIVNAIILELKRQIAEKQALLEACKKAWEFLSRFQVARVKYSVERNMDTGPRLDQLTNLLVDILTDAKDAIDGILILIDEADKPESSAHLGQLCKLLTERLSRRGCERVCIGLAGLPDIRTKLKESHESAPRIFNVLTLMPLEPGERETVIDRGLADAAEKNGFRVEMAAEAKSMIANLSEGYPHFLQEFAHCAFAKDADNNVDIQDVFSGAFGENGGLDQLGKKYFTGLYIDQIGSPDYRKVLMSMAEHGDEWVARPKIIEESGVKTRIVDNALHALKDRKIIVQNPEVRGAYKLPTKAFAVWIKAREAIEN